jgi:hypothetical protein
VADGGLALRAGQAAAWEKVPCHGDVFHAERELGKLAFYLTHRAAGCVSARQKLEHQMMRHKRHGRGNRLSRRLAVARQAELAAVALAQAVRILADWLREDILSLAGPDLPVRRELYDLVVRELAQREGLCPHRIGPVRRALAGQRDDLLAFAGVLEEEFAALAGQFDVPACWVQQLCQLEARDPKGPSYWQYHGPLLAKLREKFLPLQQAVRAIMAGEPSVRATVRPNSSTAAASRTGWNCWASNGSTGIDPHSLAAPPCLPAHPGRHPSCLLCYPKSPILEPRPETRYQIHRCPAAATACPAPAGPGPPAPS